MEKRGDRRMLELKKTRKTIKKCRENKRQAWTLILKKTEQFE